MLPEPLNTLLERKNQGSERADSFLVLAVVFVQKQRYQ